jgi:hypothetical protein
MIGWKNKRVWNGIRGKDQETEVQSVTNTLPIEFSMGITLVLIKCNYKPTMNFTTKLIKGITL